MTAQQLTDDLKASGIAEFGLEASQASQTFPSKYFDHSVTVIPPLGGTITPRDPGHCATSFGAEAVSSVLDADAIVYGNAVNFAGLDGGWKDSRDVPYLQFGTKYINAGLLLQYFNHGYPASAAMASCAAEIQNA